MKNKGFSLVELIIVIAIMAILAAAIAPALIRYIDKSRRADDVAAAETINTSAQAALSNEAAYDEIMGAMGSGDVVICTAIADGTGTFALHGSPTGVTNGAATFINEINSSQGGNAPKLKYNKKADGTHKATHWTVGVSDVGKPIVWLGTAAGNTQYQIQPSISEYYK